MRFFIYLYNNFLTRKRQRVGREKEMSDNILTGFPFTPIFLPTAYKTEHFTY